MRVDVWADLVCPWCYLGKRRFERAVAELGAAVEVVHHSFQLDPAFPRGESRPVREVLAGKFGKPLDEVDAMQDDMEQLAAVDGLEYHLAGVHLGNTVDGHRLVHLAAARGVAGAVLDRFYRAHFTEQRSLFDHGSLVDLAAEAGLDAGEARAVLESDEYEAEVVEDGERARALGATGVPFFVVDGRFGVAGAQSSEVFGQVLRRALGEQAPATT